MNVEVVRRWFMIHTYSGYEKKVEYDLKQKIETLGMSDKVSGVIVPEETVTTTVRGKQKKVLRKLFPGYVMVEMEAVREENESGISFKVDSDAWFAIRNTNGVTGFVGVGADPIPMEENEVRNIFKIIGLKIPKEDFDLGFDVNDVVTISGGAFNGRTGKVTEINKESMKVKISVDIFGRSTPVEVDITAVQKV